MSQCAAFITIRTVDKSIGLTLYMLLGGIALVAQAILHIRAHFCTA